MSAPELILERARQCLGLAITSMDDVADLLSQLDAQKVTDRAAELRDLIGEFDGELDAQRKRGVTLRPAEPRRWSPDE